jgi:hypothetical protein
LPQTVDATLELVKAAGAQTVAQWAAQNAELFV